MREIYDLRISDDLATKYLGRDVGKTIGVILHVRQITTTPQDPLFEKIRAAQRSELAVGSHFVSSVIVRRLYSQRELNNAELLALRISRMFEPAGEECGTIYDDSAACWKCHAPRRQVTDLALDLTKFPKGQSAAVTIARNEVVFTDQLTTLIRNAGLTGIDFRSIRQCRATKSKLPPFWQPQITSSSVSIAAQTKFGTNVFDDGIESFPYVCEFGPVVGLNRLSELYVTRSTWDGSDFAETRQYTGVRRGLINPRPLLVLSQHARRSLEGKTKGLLFEIVHLV